MNPTYWVVRIRRNSWLRKDRNHDLNACCLDPLTTGWSLHRPLYPTHSIVARRIVLLAQPRNQRICTEPISQIWDIANLFWIIINVGMKGWSGLVIGSGNGTKQGGVQSKDENYVARKLKWELTTGVFAWWSVQSSTRGNGDEKVWLGRRRRSMNGSKLKTLRRDDGEQ